MSKNNSRIGPLRSFVRYIYSFSPLSLVACFVYGKLFTATKLKHYQKNETIFCVGSGPSLNEVPAGEIENSTIIFLNASILKAHKFRGRGNQLFWYCQDVDRIWEFIDSVPDGVTKIITAHMFKKVYGLHRKLKNSDVFLQPVPSIRSGIGDRIGEKKGRKTLRPRYFGINGVSFLPQNINKRFHIGPKTVMFSAIYLSLFFQPKNIVLLGFDVPEHLGSYTQAEGLNVSDRSSGIAFPGEVIKYYLEGLLGAAKKLEVNLYNYSPLTNEKVLPKLKSLSAL